MQARLKVIQENANLKQVKLLPVTVIGRAAECQLKIASTQVSRRHCRITVTNNDVLIEDLNSANGTYVNQERLTPGKPTPVLPGTTLHIGPAAFVVDYTPPLTLETMPTTVIKSAELPFLQGTTVEFRGIAESGDVSSSDSCTERAPDKAAPADDSSVILPGDARLETPEDRSTGACESAAATPSLGAPEFLPPAPPPATSQPVQVAAAPAEPASRSSERKTGAVDHPLPAKPAAAIPTAAVVRPPAAPSVATAAEAVSRQSPQSTENQSQAVTIHQAIDETIAGRADVRAVPPAGQSFDFLAEPREPLPPAAAAGAFDFGSASPAASKPSGAASKLPASKRSIFNLFGKKEKQATTATNAVQPSSVVDEPASEQPPSASDTSFEFFDKPTPAFPPSAIPLSPPPDSPAADDPFAFLK